MKKYEWEVRFNDETGTYYLEKLVNMSMPEVIDLDSREETYKMLADLLNRVEKLEKQIKEQK